MHFQTCFESLFDSFFSFSLFLSFIPFQAEARAEFAERTVARLLKEVDKLEGKVDTLWYFSVTFSLCIPLLASTDQLSHEKEKYKSLTDEMDQAFQELTGSN